MVSESGTRLAAVRRALGGLINFMSFMTTFNGVGLEETRGSQSI